jgi:hypothetical protein
MSTGQQEQSPSTSEIRDEVRRTLQKLTELARTEKDFDQFCGAVLRDVVKITGAHCSVLWQFDGKSVPRITHQAGDFPHAMAAEIVSPENVLHYNAVKEVITKKLPVGLASEAFTGRPTVDGEEKTEPPFLLLFSPIFDRNKNCRGTIELIQRGEISPQAQEGYLRFLTQVAQLFLRWNEHQDLAKLSQSADNWDNRIEFINEAHRSIDPEEATYSIANEARRLLKCDRVSVGRWNGRRCKIDAISSQDRFDNRANVVRLLSNVATAAVKSDTRFWVVGNTEGLAPEVAKKINEYLDEAHSRTLIVVPLMARPPAAPDLEMKSKHRPKSKKLGAIVLEYFDADVHEAQVEDDCKLIVEQSEISLENARKHSEIFMQPVWKRLGWLQKVLFRDHLAKTITGLVALALVTLALIFVPWELKMKVEGVMHPTVRRTIFSQSEGLISDVVVDEQQEVSLGQTLLEIEDPDLETQISTAELQYETLGHQIDGFNAKSNMRDLEPVEREELRISIKTAKQERRSLIKQLEILNRKKAYQTITSPIEGTIITPQPKRRLTGLPVTRDFALLEVADLKGAWQLELKIPEGRVGYVDKALAEAKGEPLHVEFKIGSNPNLTLDGKLISIARRAVPSEQGVTEFRAIVEIEPDELKTLDDELRSGVGVTARIFCGQYSSGFVCFYQVYDFMRTQVFF